MNLVSLPCKLFSKHKKLKSAELSRESFLFKPLLSSESFEWYNLKLQFRDTIEKYIFWIPLAVYSWTSFIILFYVSSPS